MYLTVNYMFSYNSTTDSMLYIVKRHIFKMREITYRKYLWTTTMTQLICIGPSLRRSSLNNRYDTKVPLTTQHLQHNEAVYITLHYSDNCFQRKNFNHFTRVKRNRKNEFSVDVWKQVVMWQIWFLEEACSRQRQLRRWRRDHQLYNVGYSCDAAERTCLWPGTSLAFVRCPCSLLTLRHLNLFFL